MKLTSADQQLLSVLREDARASTAEIARRLRPNERRPEQRTLAPPLPPPRVALTLA